MVTEQHIPFGGAGDWVHEPCADGVDRFGGVLQITCVRGLGAKEVSGWAGWRRSAGLSHGRHSAWLSGRLLLASLAAWVQRTKGAPTLSVLSAGADHKADRSQGATGAAAPASVQSWQWLS